MNNQALEKQKSIVERFKLMIEHQHLAHAYLLTGARGSGKKDVARWVAMRLFCRNLQNGNPCETCEECQRIMQGQHPDVVEVAPDGQSIKVEQVRFLKSEFSKSGMEGSQKIFILDEAHKMTTSAANSLLKFIEEPAGEVTAFLLTENKSLVLPTIMSRTEVIELKPLAKQQIVQGLVEQNISPADANILANLSSDSNEINQLLEEGWFSDSHKALSKWFFSLARGDLSAFVDVQTRLVGLARDRWHQEKLLDMILFYGLDLLKLKFNQNQIVYESEQKELREIADQKSIRKLLEVVDIMLPLRNKLNQNFNFQGMIEKATLEMGNAFK